MARFRILIVENERIVAEVIRLTLLDLDYEVAEIATNGKEAVEKCAATQPDLVLMDIVLDEGIDGIEPPDRIRFLFRYSDYLSNSLCELFHRGMGANHPT